MIREKLIKYYQVVCDFYRDFVLAKVYAILVIAAVLKQLVWETGLVDSGEFQAAAMNLATSGFPDSCFSKYFNCSHWLHETRRTLGYPLIIILFGYFPVILLIVQAVIAMLIPVQTTLLFQSNFKNRRTIHVFLGFLLAYPLGFFYLSYMLPEVWTCFFLLIWLSAIAKKKMWNVSLSTGALILLKPAFLILLPMVLVLFFQKPLKRLLLLLPFGMVVLVSFFNKSHTGVFHFSSMATENAYEYNARAILNQIQKPFEVEAWYRQNDAQLKKLDYSGKMQLMRETTKQVLVEHKLLYVWEHILGAAKTMLDPGRYDAIAYFGIADSGGFMQIKKSGNLKQSFQLMSIPLLGFVVIFTAINIFKWVFFFRFALPNWKKTIWVWITLILLLAAVGPVGSARYLYPMVPVISFIAALGLVNRKSHEENTLVE